jgi:hypothetical protein
LLTHRHDPEHKSPENDLCISSHSVQRKCEPKAR